MSYLGPHCESSREVSQQPGGPNLGRGDRKTEDKEGGREERTEEKKERERERRDGYFQKVYT